MHIAVDLREMAWAAGLFEGEGSFSPHRVGKGGMSAQLTSTDLDTLERFQRAVGVGNINGPYIPSSSRGVSKPYWKWSAHAFERVQNIIAMLWFGLGARRREQARKTLASRGEPRGRIRTTEEGRRVAMERWSA